MDGLLPILILLVICVAIGLFLLTGKTPPNGRKKARSKNKQHRENAAIRLTDSQIREI